MPVVAQVGLSIQIGSAERLRTDSVRLLRRNQPFLLRAPQFYYPSSRVMPLTDAAGQFILVSRSVWYRTNNIPRLRPERRWKQDNDNRSRRDSNSGYRNNKRAGIGLSSTAGLFIHN